MKHVPVLSLVFITLIAVSRGDLTGSWYAANVINDGDFSPKPISEIFSTESPFSTVNPIVVLPSSSTLSPPISSSLSSADYSSFSTGPYSSDVVSNSPSTFSTGTSVVPLSSTHGSQSNPTQGNFDPQKFPFLFPQIIPDKAQGSPDPFLVYQQGLQSQSTFPTSPDYQSTFSTSTSLSTPRPSSLPDLSTPQTTWSTFQPELSTMAPPGSSTPGSSTTRSSTPGSSTPSTWSTFRPEVSTPASTWSTLRPDISTTALTWSTPPSTWTTMRPDMSTPTFSTPRPSTLSTSGGSTSRLTSTAQSSSPTSTSRPLTLRSTRTAAPCATSTVGPLQSGSTVPPKFPILRIRMIAPSGSITNIHLNPTVSSTTKRPPTRRTTTTKKPTTTRTRRTRKAKNNYNSCVNACRGKSPICATPLAKTPIDPDKLKGFQSICHMACHNSFMNDQYEMLVDGRCGKLRTRIKTADNNKIKKVELNKAQYTVVNNNEPQTIVEFSSQR